MAIPKLALIPSGYKDGKVYSVLPNSGDGDFTFSRGSNATRVNKDGLIETMPLELGSELVTNGGFDTDSNWAKGTGWSISGVASCDGSQTSNSNLYQSVVLPSGFYSITYTLSNRTAGLIRFFNFGGSVHGRLIGEDGTHTEVLYLSSNNGNFGFQADSAFTGSIDNVSVKEVLSGLDTPRLDYSDSSCPSLLLEPQATNVITNSNLFTPNSSVIVNTGNSISPDGTLNASKVTANSGTSLKLVDTNGASSGTYRFSVFAKKGTHNIMQLGGGGIVGHANFNLETGGYSSGGFMENYGNGWYRCSVQFSAGTPTSHYVSFSDSLSANRLSTSVSTGSFFLFGMQSETTSYPTSYIPTNGASATRYADICNGAGTSDTFNDSEGVLMAEISALANDGTSRRIALSNGNNTNRIEILYTSSNDLITYLVVSGNTAQATNSGSAITTQFNKVAVKYKANDFAFWINGFELLTDDSGITPTDLNTLRFEQGDGGNDFYGNTKQLQYYNTALTDSEIEELTSWESFILMANGQNYTIE